VSLRSAANQFLIAAAFAVCAFAQNTPPDAIIYKERPEAGPAQKGGRDFPSSGGATIHGIDINSGVDVNIDPNKLVAALAASGIGNLTKDQQKLLDRIVLLQKLMTDVDTAAKGQEEVIRLFDTASDAVFIAKKSANSHLLEQVRASLANAMVERMTSEGMSANAATKQANDTIGLLGFGDPTTDWPKLREIITRELTAAQTAYQASEPNIGVSVEIQGHLVPRSGDPYAIPLPGYNSVQPGPVSRYEKVRAEIPTDQRKLYDQYVELAKKTQEAKGTGDALLVALRSDFAASPFKAQLEKIETDAQNVKKLVEAIDAKSIESWLKSLAQKQAADNPADKKLVDDVTDLVAQVKKVRLTFTGLANVAAFQAQVRNSPDPVAALQQIMSQFKAARGVPQELNDIRANWTQVVADFQNVTTDLKSVSGALKSALTANDSPLAPLLAPGAGLDQVKEDVLRFVDMVESYLDAETTAIAVGNLPVPAGQKRIDVMSKNTSTSFDLTTVPGTRSPGDNVRLGYAFYAGDKQLTSPAWTDIFDIRVYGLQDKVVASLAMIRQISEEKFKPTAAMSWLLTYNNWPKTADDKPRSRNTLFSGVGLTTMALDFDPNETVEIGVAPTLSFISDRILIGYGWNLQVNKKRTYAFFSIHLLSRPGFLSDAK